MVDLCAAPMSVISMVGVQAYPQCINVFVAGTWLSIVESFGYRVTIVILWLKCTMASGYV